VEEEQERPGLLPDPGDAGLEVLLKIVNKAPSFRNKETPGD
jgi:hypothetical protein